MTGPLYTDDELAARIAAGDWAGDVDGPRVDTIVGLVTRRRQRRAAADAGVVAFAAAAVVAGVLALHGTAPTPPVASQPTGTTQVTVPTATVSHGDGPVNCLATQSRLLMSRGPYGATSPRPTQVVFVENVGRHPCSISEPALSVGIGRDDPQPVSVTSTSRGPWTLAPHHALILTVRAPRPSTCMRSSRPLESRRINIELPGWTYSFPFPGMNVLNCDHPPAAAVRVGLPPAS